MLSPLNSGPLIKEVGVMAGKQDKQIRFYKFLVEHANSEEEFTIEDIMKATGWAKETARTYVAKQVKDLIVRETSGLVVKRQMLGVSQTDFLNLVSQKEHILPRYERNSYERLVTYEFLLPLTKEDTLRRALDQLFYRDTLERRIQQLRPQALAEAVPRGENEANGMYISRVAEIVSRMFGGYSVSHVGGRFLAAPLATQQAAIGQRYVIDETTAIVRFIIPCECTKMGHGEAFDATAAATIDDRKLREEVSRIRILFFNIFVEAVADAVLEEDEIWLLESAANRSKLYIWSKA